MKSKSTLDQDQVEAPPPPRCRFQAAPGVGITLSLASDALLAGPVKFDLEWRFTFTRSFSTPSSTKSRMSIWQIRKMILKPKAHQVSRAAAL